MEISVSILQKVRNSKASIQVIFDTSAESKPQEMETEEKRKRKLSERVPKLQIIPKVKKAQISRIQRAKAEKCLKCSLPYGWKKIGYQRQNRRKRCWYFHVFSPCGRRFRSNPEIDRYLDQNPEVKCDRNVTNTYFW